jgi:orotidine-5'-phosphate decarboxylase
LQGFFFIMGGYMHAHTHHTHSNAHFNARLVHAWQTQQSMLCVGLDPDLNQLPSHLAPMAAKDPLLAIETFCLGIMQATAPFCAAFKPQIAYFASARAESVLEKLGNVAKDQYPHHIWLLDAKRGDIGSTAEHYAKEAYLRYQADAVTVNPYMGTDSIAPYLQYETRGIFVLCRTSNPGGDDFQMLTTGAQPLYLEVANRAANDWNQHQQVGLVVGATYPKEIAQVRQVAKHLPLLIPGIGAQGGDLAATVKAAKTPEGGMLINSSRAILYASAGQDWQAAAAAAARTTSAAINQLL